MHYLSTLLQEGETLQRVRLIECILLSTSNILCIIACQSTRTFLVLESKTLRIHKQSWSESKQMRMTDVMNMAKGKVLVQPETNIMTKHCMVCWQHTFCRMIGHIEKKVEDGFLLCKCSYDSTVGFAFVTLYIPSDCVINQAVSNRQCGQCAK